MTTRTTLNGATPKSSAGLAGPMSRRRFIRISGVAAGLGLAALGGWTRLARASPILHQWRGVALGADASLRLYHPDAEEAERLIADALADPPQELVELLAASARYARATGGAFDATVQPLWDLYTAHFGVAGADPSGPPRQAIERALSKCGYRRVILAPERIEFAGEAVAVTLNGIAQGYITDRVAELLRDRGIGHTLVDMGETRALDNHPAGRPWSVGIKDPHGVGIVKTIAIDNQAISTSGGYGTELDAAGRFNHIFDPATGLCAARYLSVSVIAPTATCADALSTAFSVMPIDRVGAVLAETGALAAYFVLNDGTIVEKKPQAG